MNEKVKTQGNVEFFSISRMLPSSDRNSTILQRNPNEVKGESSKEKIKFVGNRLEDFAPEQRESLKLFLTIKPIIMLEHPPYL